MAIHRGIQSVIFYYLSCAPCTGVSYRRKRRAQAKKDREETQAIWDLHPDAYRHPDPFATNPAWQIEMDLGPTHGAAAERKKKRGEVDLWHMRTRSVSLREEQTLRTSEEQARAQQSPNVRVDSRLGIRMSQHQREDEELWGTASCHARDPTEDSSATVMVTRPSAAYKTDTSRYSSGTSSRIPSWQWAPNPPISDRHPATVTNYRHKEDAAWMLQPPPPARVMQGKEPARKKRPDTSSTKVNSQGVSRHQSKDSASRKETILNDQTRLEAPAMARDQSDQTTSTAKTRTPNRRPNLVINIDYMSSSDEEPSRTPRRRKRARMPVNIPNDSDVSDSSVIRKPLGQKRLNAAMPTTLPTIQSPKKWQYSQEYDGRREQVSSEWETVDENDSRRGSTAGQDSRLRQAGKEFLDIDAWYGWATERVPRTVNHRWSMDL